MRCVGAECPLFLLSKDAVSTETEDDWIIIDKKNKIERELAEETEVLGKKPSPPPLSPPEM
jgi:hypothetical protein